MIKWLNHLRPSNCGVSCSRLQSIQIYNGWVQSGSTIQLNQNLIEVLWSGGIYEANFECPLFSNQFLIIRFGFPVYYFLMCFFLVFKAWHSALILNLRIGVFNALIHGPLTNFFFCKTWIKVNMHDEIVHLHISINVGTYKTNVLGTKC